MEKMTFFVSDATRPEMRSSMGFATVLSHLAVEFLWTTVRAVTECYSHVDECGAKAMVLLSILDDAWTL